MASLQPLGQFLGRSPPRSGPGRFCKLSQSYPSHTLTWQWYIGTLLLKSLMCRIFLVLGAGQGQDEQVSGDKNQSWGCRAWINPSNRAQHRFRWVDMCKIQGWVLHSHRNGLEKCKLVLNYHSHPGEKGYSLPQPLLAFQRGVYELDSAFQVTDLGKKINLSINK